MAPLLERKRRIDVATRGADVRLQDEIRGEPVRAEARDQSTGATRELVERVSPRHRDGTRGQLRIQHCAKFGGCRDDWDGDRGAAGDRRVEEASNVVVQD